MRIIGGELGGRRLLAPKGSATRPTSDRVRESLFSILGRPDAELDVLDLFAGAGTLGFEALSRGARSCVFVEAGKPAAAVIKRNIDTLDLHERSSIVVAKLPGALERRAIAGRRFGWVFLDPPYKSDLGSATLDRLAHSDLLADDATVIIEHDKRRPPASELGSLVRTDSRRYGDTDVSFFKRDPT